jgi:hypothetical protein
MMHRAQVEAGMSIGTGMPAPGVQPSVERDAQPQQFSLLLRRRSQQHTATTR